MMKRFLALFTLTLNLSTTQAKINPLEKIEIKSNRAFTTPLKNNPNLYLVRYEQNVQVELADKTHMSAETLEVIIAHKPSKGNVKNKSSTQSEETKKVIAALPQQIKSVIFKGHVKINRLNHTVRADRAELLVEKKQCTAQGNVHIVQKKISSHDIPVIINSEKAILDLTSEKLLLVGTEQAPVSTVFEIKQEQKATLPINS